ncbi:MAG TPA: formate dehydrogenase accessory sulfurtransferase FdhD [Planctomycetota bacterium]|nr:formate dehydrogenase accessory sulfurtransferase FdhD [Planctomycetota bacterium]HRR83232.1 formate dehydrogenase accessory sulfurtransferase FdhD [Planctomycetota bacterium]HRT96897.1 formate dehydrogenase accessory sulfurtransferase FdhD [Planctomycetota bacterium]
MRGEADQGGHAGGSGRDLTTPVRVVRVRGEERSELEDVVVRERTVALVVGGQRLLRLQCLPEAVEDLALGLLVTSALLPPTDPVPPIAWAPDEGEVRVDFAPPQGRVETLQRNLTLGSGCGSAMSSVKGYDPLDCWRKIDTSFRVSPAAISAAMRAFLRRSEVYVETGGVHAAAIVRGGEMVAFAEDIGRHNAFDKVIGACRRQAIGLEDTVALVTGRLSQELVAKAIPASIPVLVSRGAPTDASVRLADEANLTLIGFARADRMNVYAAEWRIR